MSDAGNFPKSVVVTKPNALQKTLYPFDSFAADDPNVTNPPTLTLKSPWKFNCTLSDSLISLLLPPGSIQMYGGAAAPSGWLLCDGTSYLRSSYPGLFTSIGTTFGSIDGTHFNVPNFQGISPTGAGNQAISGRTKTGPALGTVREDQGQSHIHTISRPFGGGSVGSFANFAASNNNLSTVDISTPSDDGVGGGTPRMGAYTHGPEIGINFIIKT